MNGKEKCEWLKRLRARIARMNGIDYEPVPCDFDGVCPGYCPQCDQESKDLMKALRIKEAAGEPIRFDTSCLEQLQFLAQGKEQEQQEDDNAPETDALDTSRTVGYVCSPYPDLDSVVGNSRVLFHSLFDSGDGTDAPHKINKKS